MKKLLILHLKLLIFTFLLTIPEIYGIISITDISLIQFNRKDVL